MALQMLLPPGDAPDALARFSFQHMQDHNEIDAALQAKGVTPYIVPLDPTPWDQSGAAWLQLHQRKHALMDAALNIQSTDLTGFDLSKSEDRQAFIGSNYTEHLYARTILGI